MSVFPGTYILTNASTTANADVVNKITDSYITPRLMFFRQITIYNERGTLQADGVTWAFTYQNWNTTFPLIVKKNGKLLLPVQYGFINYEYGTLETGLVATGDVVEVTYNFDYFPIAVLEGLILMSVDVINDAAYGSRTGFTLVEAPAAWDAVMADLTIAMCMERLILDYDMWKGRLVFAIPNIEEGGDVVAQLETFKRNAEDRANKSLENEKFKIPNFYSPPTSAYYSAIRGFGRSGMHTDVLGYGKLRGWRPTRYR